MTQFSGGKQRGGGRQELRPDVVSMATLRLHDYERDQLRPRKRGDSHHTVPQSWAGTGSVKKTSLKAELMKNDHKDQHHEEILFLLAYDL